MQKSIQGNLKSNRSGRKAIVRQNCGKLKQEPHTLHVIFVKTLKE
jgi:hypothetical protein